MSCREAFGKEFEPLQLADFAPKQSEPPVDTQIRIPSEKKEKVVIRLNTKKMKVDEEEDEDFENESEESSQFDSEEPDNSEDSLSHKREYSSDDSSFITKRRK